METRRTRILHVIPHLGPGGSERFMLTLLKGLDPSKIESRLCVLGSANAFPGRVNPAHEPVFLGYAGSLRDWRGMMRCVGRLRKLIRSWHPDIVHSHLWPACRFSSAAAWGLPQKQVYQIQDTRPWLAGHAPRDLALKAATRVLRRIGSPHMVAVSEAAKRYTCQHLGMAPADVDVIYNCVDLSEFDVALRTDRPADHRPVVFGMAALFKPEKGHRQLIDAFSRVVKMGIDVELRLAGSGSLQAPCVEQVAALNLTERVRFEGLVDDVPAFLAGLDVLVLPSLFGEGLPLTVLEGMAMGLPVVATRVAGTPEALDDRRTGRLVPPGDVDALAEAMATLAGDTDMRRQMGAEALADVRRRFSLEAVARGMTAVYDRLLREEPAEGMQ